jgi:predicted TIM-barrel enzyme
MLERWDVRTLNVVQGTYTKENRMAFITRAEALKNLYGQIEAGRPIIGCGAGTGISAKCAEAGGADLIIIYNSGRYRMAGRGSLAGLLPYGDANGIVVEMAAEVLPVVKKTPVQAGVCGTDPFRLMPVFLKQLKEMGFTGVQNFPTVGLFDGNFRANLEATGMGYDKEVEMVRLAHEMDLLTTPYAFTPDEARAMAQAGADILVAHVGLTTGGTIGAGVALSLDEAIGKVMAMADAGRKVRKELIVICHGGPFDEPEAVGEALARMPGIAGFFGATSIERLPTERAITGQVKDFKSLKVA